jgi:hypothetical protein
METKITLKVCFAISTAPSSLRIFWQVFQTPDAISAWLFTHLIHYMIETLQGEVLIALLVSAAKNLCRIRLTGV